MNHKSIVVLWNLCLLMMEWDRKYVTIRDPKRKQEENKPALKFKKKENNIGNSKDQSTNELFDHVNKYVN